MRIRSAPKTVVGALVVLLALAGVWPPAGAQAETLMPAQRPGYWVASSDGAVLGFGDAASARTDPGAATPVVGVAAKPGGDGYWTVASDGGVFAFGDAGFFGSTGALRLARPIVGMASTPTGRGYWMVASDGGVFAFGDAGFLGSAGALALAEPIVGMASTATGLGYWMVASDGGIFSFGDAGFLGSATASAGRAIVGMASKPATVAAADPPAAPDAAAPVPQDAAKPSGYHPISFVGGDEGPKASSGSLKLPRPRGTEPGDVLIVAVAEHEVGTASAPSGWTLVREDSVKGDIWQWIWYHVVTASEPTAYTFKVGDPAANGAILAYRGVDPTDPVEASAAGTEDATKSAIEAPSMNVTVPGTMLVMVSMIEGPSPNPITPPPGFTERTFRGVHPSLETCDMLFPKTGPTGDRVAKAKYGGSVVGSIGTIMALRPAAL